MLKFLKIDDNGELYMPCIDGKKCCFIFSNSEMVEKFAEKLSERINAKLEISHYIGYIVIYVPVEKYKEALEQGINIILDRYRTKGIIKGVYLVNCYNERCSCYGAQILQMDVATKHLNMDGFWNPFIKLKINLWKQKLEKVVGKPVIVEDYCGYARFHIDRITPQIHEDILNKIRENKQLFEKTPFTAYALVNYYGEFVEI